MTTVRHATCGELVERDEFDFLDEHHRTGACRGSAHHPPAALPKSDRSQMRSRKGRL